MRLSQNETGRAFEYGVALSLSKYLPAPIQDGVQIRRAKRCFEVCDETEQHNILRASSEVTAFLAAHDVRLSETGCSIRLQSDQLGRQGDVRDIIVHNAKLNEEIGISAKNRHLAVKHSRLSERIDFGFDWLGIHCSQNYFDKVTPIFRELRSRKRRGEKWRDIPNKRQLYYMPVLQAFRTEIQLLSRHEPRKVPRALLQYLLGKFDYYKVIKENGAVSIMSFNINGTLKWGSRLPFPTRIIEISQKPKSDTTLVMAFDQGWQISFRIHNASTMVEPSLKFDINIVGLPHTMSRHVIEYRG
ncbi:HaeIII family restriction endonuclease [bacterium]|nr:HaeIII family restriction endonuclease [bacterium]